MFLRFRQSLFLLRPPYTSRVFVGRQNIFTGRLVWGEFRQVCDKIGPCQAISDSACRALSASVRWTKTICRGSRAPQPVRKCHKSHVSGIGAILILDDSAPSLNAVSHDKKSASVRQADGPTNFNPIWPRQKICSSTTENRLVCGSLKARVRFT